MSLDALLQRDRTLFLGNLSGTVTEGQLRQHLQHIGLKVDGISIQRNERGDARCAFLTLSSATELERALTELPARPLLGQPLRVGRAGTPGETVPWSSRPMSQHPPAHIFVGNLPLDASETDLALHVQSVAPVVSVGVPRRHDGRGSGVAFVTLRDPQDADRIVAELDGVRFQGRPLRVQHPRSPA